MSETETGVSAPEFSAALCLWALDLVSALAPCAQWDVLCTSRTRHPATVSARYGLHASSASHRKLRPRDNATVESDTLETEDEEMHSDIASSTEAEEENNDLDNESEKVARRADDADEEESKEETNLLDLRPSEFNNRLLGRWIQLPVIQKLLRIIFSCLMVCYFLIMRL